MNYLTDPDFRLVALAFVTTCLCSGIFAFLWAEIRYKRTIRNLFGQCTICQGCDIAPGACHHQKGGHQ